MVEWTVKELTRVITLCRKGMPKKPTRLDTKLLFKLEIQADEIMIEEDIMKIDEDDG